eukprot:s329_g7.t1
MVQDVTPKLEAAGDSEASKDVSSAVIDALGGVPSVQGGCSEDETSCASSTDDAPAAATGPLEEASLSPASSRSSSPASPPSGSKGFLERLQDMIQDIFQKHEAAGDSEPSRDVGSAFVSEGSKAPGVHEGLALPAESGAEKKLKDAMRARDPQHLKLALRAAKAAKVRAEVLLEAHDALQVLQDSQHSLDTASLRLRPDSSDTLLNIHVCQTLDAIYQCFQTPEVADGDAFLKACCQEGGCCN